MFDMGFHAQVHSICAHVRPDRQTLLFSATFRKKVEKLARVALSDPIRVVQVWKIEYILQFLLLLGIFIKLHNILKQSAGRNRGS
jgi:superfamily II DNA/RNA helicase